MCSRKARPRDQSWQKIKNFAQSFFKRFVYLEAKTLWPQTIAYQRDWSKGYLTPKRKIPICSGIAKKGILRIPRKTVLFKFGGSGSPEAKIFRRSYCRAKCVPQPSLYSTHHWVLGTLCLFLKMKFRFFFSHPVKKWESQL